MAVSKKGKTLIILTVFLPVLFTGLLLVNWFVYPFTSAKPNFADVEAVYDKMVVPSDWVKKVEGSNKGIAGRQCPIESDGCFSKAATFGLPQSEYQTSVDTLAKSMGCPSSNLDRVEQSGGPATASFRCASGGIIVSGTIIERGSSWEGYVNVSSR